MGRVIRGNVSQIMRAAHQYLFYRDQESAAKKLKDKATAVPGDKKRNLLKDYVAEHGEKNGKDIEWLFDEPLTIGDVTYLGLRNQGKTDTFMDVEKAQELIESKGLRDRVVKTVTTEVWDYEELYVLNQQDLLTDDEIDSLMISETNYSLVVIT